MAFPDDIPTSKMSPPQFASLSNNDFKREGTSPSNALICPPPRMTLPQSNKSDHIFYKTRICTKFRFGTCRNGQNCNFAHGAEELRQPPPHWQKLVGLRSEGRMQLGNHAKDKKIIQTMKLCKNYCNGEECPYGDNCIFLHEDPAQFRDDSLKLRECSAITIETNNLEGSRALNKQARSTYRKTKLCRNWKHTGYCSFGMNCLFAHGEEDVVQNVIFCDIMCKWKNVR
ncbi:putative transcription factor C3H family [Medicago truncatula]|uniref:Putative transcription factor C3H family n=1 Tax=Medicago truncatula TaxID=3880 RepID=A0A396IGG1_MEDTR|nr:putative transcription factor C3H family [Medicago truncatula]